MEAAECIIEAPSRPAPSFWEHSEWCRQVASAIYRRVRHLGIERDDVVQNASLGLIEALDRFDPSRGVPFRAYALPRVRGSVFNGLRAAMPQAGLHRVPVMSERTAHLAESDEPDHLSYLAELVGGLGVGLLLTDAFEALVDPGDVPGRVHSEQLHIRLRSALAGLPPRLRELLEAHYVNHLPFNQWAASAGISKGRVAQLHRSALTQLRAALEAHR